MKKYLLSLSVIGAFAFYVLSQRSDVGTVAIQPNAQTQSSEVQSSTTASVNPVASGTPKTAKGSTSVSKTPVPVKKTQGQYVDGSYTGNVADAFYGNIQVKVTVQGGKLTDVVFLDYPHDRRTSELINSQAMPLLKSEAIQAQSAQVDGVSGATATSEAFVQSLSAALAQAKA